MGKTRKNKVFDSTEYNSNDGMLTTVWGPSAWHFLHTMSFNYPVNPSAEDKQHYMQYVLNLKHVLPCGKCRKNLRKNLKDLPLKMKHMESRDTFSKYIYDLHEKVNTMLGKDSGLSYDDVRERYEHFRARCAKPVICKRVTRKKKEDGCTEPMYKGEKSKCVLHIVPQKEKCKTFQIDEKCIKKRID